MKLWSGVSKSTSQIQVKPDGQQGTQMAFSGAMTKLKETTMLSIDVLRSRGVCLWAYAKSQSALERMIHDAELLIDVLDVIKEKRGTEVRSARQRVLQWDWEMRSQLCLLFRQAEPVLGAFRSEEHTSELQSQSNL